MKSASQCCAPVVRWGQVHHLHLCGVSWGLPSECQLPSLALPSHSCCCFVHDFTGHFPSHQCQTAKVNPAWPWHRSATKAAGPAHTAVYCVHVGRCHAGSQNNAHPHGPRTAHMTLLMGACEVPVVPGSVQGSFDMFPGCLPKVNSSSMPGNTHLPGAAPLPDDVLPVRATTTCTPQNQNQDLETSAQPCFLPHIWTCGFWQVPLSWRKAAFPVASWERSTLPGHSTERCRPRSHPVSLRTSRPSSSAFRHRN